jgi:site-specific recombinase XerD
MSQLIKRTPKILKKLEELEFFTQAGEGEKLHYEFFKNYNSEETRKAYYSDLKHFFNFYKMAFHKSIKHPSEVKRVHVIAYKDFLIDCGGKDQDKASNLTVRRKMATLSSYFKFMLENDKIKSNPVDGIRRPKKTPNKGTECLSDNQVRLLLDYMDIEAITHNEFTTHLHRTLIYILFYTGIRVTELINIKRKDFYIYNGMPSFRIRAKGGKIRIIPVHQDIKTILEDYFKVLRAQLKVMKLGTLNAEDYLFFSLKNNRNKDRKNISRYGVYKILNTRAFQAGIRQKISPHSARATLITSLLDQGQDLYRVSLSVGHSNPETTKIYDKRNRSIKDNAILDISY